MAQQLIQSKLGEITIVENELQDLKAIMLHSRDSKDKLVLIKVPHSRYLKILSDYWALRSINVEGLIDLYADKYTYYVLTGLDDNGNKYKIQRNVARDYKGKCEGCDCHKSRYINPLTKICYYKEMISENYTTKI